MRERKSRMDAGRWGVRIFWVIAITIVANGHIYSSTFANAPGDKYDLYDDCKQDLETLKSIKPKKRVTIYADCVIAYPNR